VSQENVEIVRAMFEFFTESQRGSTFEAFFPGVQRGPWAPDVEWDARNAEQLGLADIAAVYRGPDGVAAFWREWLAAWEAVDFEYELIDAGDQVVALIDQRMRGRFTHMEVEMGKYQHVWTFRDGLVTHWTMYVDQAEALEAAGLPRDT
jgi:ketosteroid isomerase-like protein